MDSNKPPKDSYQRLSKEREQGRNPQMHPHWPLWDKELKQHAKHLRNNFMYMGPNRSFAHLYEAPRQRTMDIPSQDQMNWVQPGVHTPEIADGEAGVSKVNPWPLDD